MCVSFELQFNIVFFTLSHTPSSSSLMSKQPPFAQFNHSSWQDHSTCKIAEKMCFYTFFPKTRFSSGYQQRFGNIIKESQSHNDSPDKVTIIKDSPDFVETRFSSRRRFSSILESSMMAHAFAVSNPVDPVIM